MMSLCIDECKGENVLEGQDYWDNLLTISDCLYDIGFFDSYLLFDNLFHLFPRYYCFGNEFY